MASLVGALRKSVALMESAAVSASNLGAAASEVDKLAASLGRAAAKAGDLEDGMAGAPASSPGGCGPYPGPSDPTALRAWMACVNSGVGGGNIASTSASSGAIASTGSNALGGGGAGGGSSSAGGATGDPCGPRPSPRDNYTAYRNWLDCKRGRRALSYGGPDGGAQVGFDRSADKAVVDALGAVKGVLDTIATNTRPSRDRGKGIL